MAYLGVYLVCALFAAAAGLYLPQYQPSQYVNNYQSYGNSAEYPSSKPTYNSQYYQVAPSAVSKYDNQYPAQYSPQSDYQKSPVYKQAPSDYQNVPGVYPCNSYLVGKTYKVIGTCADYFVCEYEDDAYQSLYKQCDNYYSFDAQSDKCVRDNSCVIEVQPKNDYTSAPVYQPSNNYQSTPVYQPKNVYTSAPVYQPSNNYQSAPVYQPKNDYTSAPVYQPKNAYTSAPVYQPSNNYQSAPAYQPKNSYTSAPVYQPKNDYPSAPVYQPKNDYTSVPVYQPSNNYQSAPVYQPKNIYTSAPVYQPKNNYPTDNYAAQYNSPASASGVYPCNSYLEGKTYAVAGNCGDYYVCVKSDNVYQSLYKQCDNYYRFDAKSGQCVSDNSCVVVVPPVVPPTYNNPKSNYVAPKSSY